MEPDRLSRELADKVEAARMSAEAVSLSAELARDTVGRWIRGSTVPSLVAFRRVEAVLSSRLGSRVDLSVAVRERRAARRPAQPPATMAPGSAQHAGIEVYLRTLIDWLNTDPWPRDRRLQGPVLTPAAIECNLRATAAKRAGEGSLDIDELARQYQRLVVLSGPGGGKTWLAKRTARRCAEGALNAISDGANLDEIELPLYITCSRLLTADGDARVAAVSSAFDYELGDLGGPRLTAAIRAFFTERNKGTLLVIDSLDEAQGSSKRLRQLATLPWRIILTSRPSTWNDQLSIDADNDAHLVCELQPLRYPDDIEPFIHRWFAERPEWGNQLCAQIAQRPGLQQAATLPLILAFYCIIGGDQPLPEFRRDLYTSVLRRLLHGTWRGYEDTLPDIDTCLDKLRSWAWLGTKGSVSGVGVWADDIAAESAHLGKVGDDALDHIATPLGRPDFDTGKTLRRFIHRSVREHLVAEHVAGLPVGEASTTLLPHLWYDPDWEYSAPAAIALHPQHDQLLRNLLCRAARSDQIPDLSAIDARLEYRRLLARVASESSEADWSPELAALIGEARVHLARSVT